MKKKVTLLAVCSILVFAGCGEDLSKQIQPKSQAALDVYHSADVKAAEEAMLSLLSFLEEARAKQPDAADYEDLEGWTWLRLYSVYEFTGDTLKADQARKQSVRLLRKRFASADESEVGRRLAGLLRGLEQNTPPLWKNQAGTLAAPPR